MADALVTRLAREVLASQPPLAALTSQGLGVLLDDDLEAQAATGTASVTRIGREVLGASPLNGLFTSQGLGVLLDDDLETQAAVGAAFVTRLGREVLGDVVESARLTSQGLDVLLDDDLDTQPGLGTATVTRLGREVLGRSAEQLETFPYPAGLDFYMHNWADESRLESTYRTDITEAQETLAEERRLILDRPERQLSVRWLRAGQADVEKFLAQLRKFPNGKMVVPLYPDEVPVSATSASGQSRVNGDFSRGRFFRNGPVLLVRFDPVTKQPVGADAAVIDRNNGDHILLTASVPVTLSPRLASVVPLMKVDEVLSIRTRLHARQVADLEVTFDETYGPTTLPPTASDVVPGLPSYRDLPIFTIPHDWSDPVEQGMERSGQRLEQGKGSVVTVRGERHKAEFSFSVTDDRAAAWDAVRFFDARRGRWLACWVLDQEDVWVVVTASGDFVSVLPTSAGFSAFQAEMAYVGLELTDGSAVVRQVVNVQEVLGVWRLTLAEPLPAAVTAASVDRVARARLCRLKSDALVEEWQTTGAVSVKMELLELLEEEEVTT